MKLRIVIFLSVLIFSGIAAAESLYVTDRILLGVHQDAVETSPVIATIPSGTAVTVLERGDNFTKVQLTDGKQGWASSGYLKPDKPATAELDAAYAQLKQAQDTVKKLNDELTKRDRDSQVRQDEISNDKNTIKELQKKLKDQSASAPSPSQEALDQIKDLQAQVKQLTEQKTTLVNESKSDSSVSLHDLQNQNQQLQVRIEAALANLQGKQIPSTSELAAIRPSFPVWYWILLFAIFIGGIAAGVGWIDYHHRKRHGGYRI